MGEHIKAISFTCILMITMQVVQIVICLALHKSLSLRNHVIIIDSLKFFSS
jgi:hypothetical protein